MAGETKTIKIERQCIVEGKPEKVGAIREVSLETARLLVGMKKASWSNALSEDTDPNPETWCPFCEKDYKDLDKHLAKQHPEES